MLVFHFDNLQQYSDVLRLQDGRPVTLRFVEPGDAFALQNYFRSLSQRSRHSRFLGAMSELPPALLGEFIHAGAGDRYSAIATTDVGGVERIIGEVRYGFDEGSSSFEFGMSIDDRWQGQGIGSALLKNLQCRAAAFGALRMFGDTLRSNAVMIGLARKSGFAFMPSPGDWALVRFEKIINPAPQEIPCASWRLAVEQIAQPAA